MNFKKIKIVTTTEGTELLPAELLELGITGFEIDDAPSFEEFLNDKRVPWDYVEEELLSKRYADSAVTVYLCENEQGASQLESIKALCKSHIENGEGELYGSLEIISDEVKEDDWANNWKQYFKPLKIGDKILIKPSWESVSDEDEKKYKIVQLDPGSSFGTGQHETTKLCLEVLQNNKTEGAKVLDMGCGTSILAILASMRGANPVTAIDIDDWCVNNSRDNIELNGINNITAELGDASLLEGREPFDVIIANINRNILLADMDRYAACMHKGSELYMSGFYVQDIPFIREKAESLGMTFVHHREKNNWAAVKFVL
jgi:ribosomal protein L11 methyltransferase